MAFSIPKDGNIFISDIRERSEALIDLGVWQGLTRTQLNAWLTNFENDLERYFAACVLDALIYRSEAQTVSLIQQLLQRTFSTVARKLSLTNASHPDWRELLRKDGSDPHVRLIPVVQEDEPPTKSAYWIVRLMKRHYNVDERWIARARDFKSFIPPSVEALVFIDDFLGTGDQFAEFFEGEGLASLSANVHLVYLPLVGFTGGVDRLLLSLPRVTVSPVERLDNTHRLFHTDCECFQDGTNSVADAQVFYYDLLAKRGIDLKGDYRRGHGGLELAYSFAHASPDNCLPILWWDKSPSWKPLFQR